MEDNLKIYKVNRTDVTEETLEQVYQVEKTGSEDHYTKEQLRELWVDSNKNDNFVCVINDKIIAHISFNPLSMRRNGSIYAVNLAVDPNYRRQGIAQKLIFAGCEYYLEKGSTLPMSISVDKDNIPALNLYLKVGFEIKEPICELDEDDTQYIFEAPLEHVYETIKAKSRK